MLDALAVLCDGHDRSDVRVCFLNAGASGDVPSRGWQDGRCGGPRVLCLRFTCADLWRKHPKQCQPCFFSSVVCSHIYPRIAAGPSSTPTSKNRSDRHLSHRIPRLVQILPCSKVTPSHLLPHTISTMASQTALIDAVSTLVTAQYYTFATFTFVTYDWLINLDEEIRCFWDFRKGRRLTAAALLYGLSRYPPIVLIILQLQTVFPMSYKVCEINYRLQTVAIIPFALTPAIFSAIRVYTLSPEHKATAIVTFLILFVPALVTSTVNATATPAVLPSPFNCTNNPVSIPPDIAHRLTIASRILSITGDILVLFVTWHKTYTSYRAQRGVVKGPSITRVLLYNGSIYFIVITVMNILESILSQAPSALALGNFATYAAPPLTAILICRFLFDLRQADRTTAAPSSPSAIQSLNLNFSVGSQGGHGPGTETLPAFVASMGEPVYTGLPFVDGIGGDEGQGLDMAHTNGGERGSIEEELP